MPSTDPISGISRGNAPLSCSADIRPNLWPRSTLFVPIRTRCLQTMLRLNERVARTSRHERGLDDGTGLSCPEGEDCGRGLSARHAPRPVPPCERPAERRGGKEVGSKCKYRWSPVH